MRLDTLEMKFSYQGEVDVSNKIEKFLRVTGMIIRTFGSNKVQKETGLNVYNTLAVPMITYGCETWALEKTAEIKFMRTMVGVTLRDGVKFKTIISKFEVTPTMKKIKSYKKKL